MSSELISRSDDLRRLRDEGYFVQIRGAYLVVYEIPYVNADGKVLRGILISKLNVAGDKTLPPDQHEIYFSGEYPCHSDGSRMTELVSQEATTKIDEQITAHYQFSRKPDRGHYEDYFEKISAYEALLSGEAEQIADVTSRVHRVEEAEDGEYPFHYLETASARADINAMSSKLAMPSVAIVGLGGTGSYVLDLVAKTHVREIHLFDGDVFANHNAFRAPGAAGIDDLRQQLNKATYFSKVYSRMRRRIVAHEMFIEAGNANLLNDVSFVFLCIDPSEAKRSVVEALEKANVPFIDVGMGVVHAGDGLSGILRVTTSQPGYREEARAEMSFADTDDEDPYDTNIQVADLNCLNASLAVIKWKKLYGFYADLVHERTSTYTIACNMLEDDAE
jgi:molybdopterin/thiamine biosynthesis adenylyltransferase